MQNFEKNEFNENIIRIIKGSFISIILTIILLFTFAIILTYTNIQESIIPTVIIIITSVSILIGSSMSTLKIKKMGLINGAIVGLFYILSIYFISSITGSGFNINLSSIIMIIASVIAGMIGGIIGVNVN